MSDHDGLKFVITMLWNAHESPTSWEEAGRHAVETAATSIRDLRVAEVVKMDMKVENGKVTAFRTRVALSFKYETS